MQTLPTPGSHARLTIGLLGGSFNPAHEGHRYISLEAMKRLGLDGVWWLVSPQNPLKSLSDMASLAERVVKAREVAAHPRITVTDIEKYFPDTYTVNTIKRLKKRYPCVQFVWIMGADNLVQFHRWHRWREILQDVPVVVCNRAVASQPALASRMAVSYWKCYSNIRYITQKTPSWTFLPIKKHPASATLLRNN